MDITSGSSCGSISKVGYEIYATDFHESLVASQHTVNIPNARNIGQEKRKRRKRRKKHIYALSQIIGTAVRIVMTHS